jgi:hypothetical protein
METPKPKWKTEALESRLVETKFDKWQLLGQVAWQLVVWDKPVTWKLKRLQEMLSMLTPEEKQMFEITEEDEEEVRRLYVEIKYYEQLLVTPEAFRGKTLLATHTLTTEEKRKYLTRPKKKSAGYWEGFWLHWDERQLTEEAQKRLLEALAKDDEFTIFGLKVDWKDVFCKLQYLKREPDGWDRREDDDCYKAFQHYSEGRKVDFGKDDPLIWKVNFYVSNASMMVKVQNSLNTCLTDARRLIGDVLRRMMRQLEGRTVYVIPEERRIP